MNETTPEHSFRGLPISAEQEAEIRHYIKQRKQRGLPLDMDELRAMLHDMLHVPRDDSFDPHAGTELQQADYERAAAAIDEAMDLESAREERLAASEAEAMKHT